MTKREDVRERILAATDDLLGRFGFRKMTIEDVAREAGIGKGTVYLHFPSKEELVLSHVDGIVDRVVNELARIASEESTDVYERLRQMLVARVVKRYDAVQHYTQSLNDVLVGLREQLLERRKRHFEREASIFSNLLVSALGWNAEQAKDTARALLASTNAFLPYNLTVQELGKKPALVRGVQSVASLLVGGVQAVQEAKSPVNQPAIADRQ